jgi:hypothetical protein
MRHQQMMKMKEDLRRALKGLIGPHQRLMLQTQLRHVDELDALIQQFSSEKARLPKTDDLFAPETWSLENECYGYHGLVSKLGGWTVLTIPKY